MIIRLFGKGMAMSERITATRVVREFSELLNEVRYKSQSYIVERNGKPIARLVPVSDSKEGKTLKELKNLLSSLPSCGDDLEAFAADLEKIAGHQPSVPAGAPWA
jgi:prevent-host-death family protein